MTTSFISCSKEQKTPPVTEKKSDTSKTKNTVSDNAISSAGKQLFYMKSKENNIAEEVARNAGGATVCWESYLKMKTPMTEDQIKSLNEYYSSLKSLTSSTEIKYETIALPVKDKVKLKEEQKTIMGLKGDPTKGEADFKNNCAFCHGENSNIKKVPSLFDEFEGNVKSITYNIRFGNGSMPFYKNSVLSDQDIADISAYILKKNGQ